MILTKAEKEVKLYIPWNCTKGCEQDVHTLKLKHPLRDEIFLFNVIDEGSFADFVVCTLDLSGMQDGEYTYILDNGLSSGIIKIGDLVMDRKERSQHNELIQYEAYG